MSKEIKEKILLFFMNTSTPRIKEEERKNKNAQKSAS